MPSNSSHGNGHCKKTFHRRTPPTQQEIPPEWPVFVACEGWLQGFGAFRHSCKIEFSPLSIRRMASVCR